MTIYLSLFVCLIGGVVYLVSTHAKAAELGRNAFWCGLLAFLLGFAGHSLTVIR